MSYDKHGGIIYAKDIDNRITELQQVYRKYARDLDDWETEELTTLLNFKSAVTGRYGEAKWADGISFISDDYADKYAQEMAEETYTGAATEFWDCDAWADHYYADWEVFTLEDVKYTTDGQR